MNNTTDDLIDKLNGAQWEVEFETWPRFEFVPLPADFDMDKWNAFMVQLVIDYMTADYNAD